jgi:Listeria-Bacteroides repeat domain (List_Bact_rpt).
LKKYTLPHYFITKGHVPEFYDRIPYIISNTDITFTYIYDWEKGMDLVKNIEVNGYEFLGWYDNPDFEGEKIERLEKGIYHNIVLYGKFVKK